MNGDERNVKELIDKKTGVKVKVEEAYTYEECGKDKNRKYNTNKRNKNLNLFLGYVADVLRNNWN